MFCGKFKFDNFYFNYHIEANPVNYSLFSCFDLHTPGVNYFMPPNVHLGLSHKSNLECHHIEIPHNVLCTLMDFVYFSELVNPPVSWCKMEVSIETESRCI